MDAKFLLVDFLQLILNQVFKRWSIKFKIEFFVTFFIALWGERKNINMHLEMNQTIYRKISNITKDMSLYFSNTLRIAPVIDSTAYCPEIYQFFWFLTIPMRMRRTLQQILFTLHLTIKIIAKWIFSCSTSN